MRKIVYTFLLVLLAACTGNRPYKAKVVSCDHSFCAKLESHKVPDVDTISYSKKINISYCGNTITVDTLYDGVSTELSGTSLLVRSAIQGVEYIVSGRCSDGMLTIVSEFSPLVTLCDLELCARGRDALQLSSREMVVVKVVGENRLSDISTGVKEGNIAAVVNVMGRSMFVGSGNIDVSAGRKNGFLLTDTAYFCGADISVDNAPGNAIRLRKSAYAASGSMRLSSVKDVVKGKGGTLTVCGATVEISAVAEKTDAVQLDAFCLTDGKVDVSVSGAAADGIKAKWICVSGGEASVTTRGDAIFSEKKLDYSSASCLKADSAIFISGGKHIFSSNGVGAKGVSCDGNTIITGGSVRVVTRGVEALHPIDLNAHASCKGIKSDANLIVDGGDVEVLVLGKGERNEGIEAKQDMAINGGSIYIYSYDDAINCGGSFVMNGGSVYAYSIANDAVDSNCSIEINGGTLIADGSFSPEQGVDVDDFSMFTLRGGAVISVGGGMGPMTSLPLNINSCANVLVWSGVPLKKGSFLNVENEDGMALVSYSLTRDISRGVVLVSSPLITKGKKYCFSISDSISGGEQVGNGLFYNSRVENRFCDASFEFDEGVLLVNGEGGVKRIFAGEKMHGNGFPPPPPQDVNDSKNMKGEPSGVMHGNGGDFSRMPPPPPPARDIKDIYSENNLPNRGV